jgi:hypothetical protein
MYSSGCRSILTHIGQLDVQEPFPLLFRPALWNFERLASLRAVSRFNISWCFSGKRWAGKANSVLLLGSCSFHLAGM